MKGVRRPFSEDSVQFDAVNALLTEKRLLLRAGTIADATMSTAPSSTKNATTTRDHAEGASVAEELEGWRSARKTGQEVACHSMVLEHAADSHFSSIASSLSAANEGVAVKDVLTRVVALERIPMIPFSSQQRSLPDNWHGAEDNPPDDSRRSPTTSVNHREARLLRAMHSLSASRGDL
jgi:hypothetical protein